MSASTHTEVYRRFSGRLRDHPLRWMPLARATIRTAGKRRLALLVLFAPPAIATVIFSFVVYARFSLEAGITPAAIGGGNPAVALVGRMAETLIQVRQQIVVFHVTMTIFTLLVFAWYGAGQIAEDGRLGANLLYFSRPLTRLDYLLGKFLAVAFYGSLAVVLPPLVICAVAAFASPEWSFLKKEWTLVPRSIAYSLAWVVAWSSAALAISSLSSRKSFALVACFAFFLIPFAISGVLAALTQELGWFAFSLAGAFQRIAGSLFDSPELAWRFDVRLAWASVGGWTALAWLVLAVRVRRLEAAL